MPVNALGLLIPDAAARQEEAARERRKRLAQQESPEFRKWCDKYMAELAAQPFAEFDDFVLSQIREKKVVYHVAPQPILDAETDRIKDTKADADLMAALRDVARGQ